MRNKNTKSTSSINKRVLYQNKSNHGSIRKKITLGSQMSQKSLLSYKSKSNRSHAISYTPNRLKRSKFKFII